MKINCIVCAADVENWDIAHPDEDVVQPIGGTVFRTYGHYGSTVFDPIDGSFLDIVICDECLKSRLDRAYPGMNEQYRSQLDAKIAEGEYLISQINWD